MDGETPEPVYLPAVVYLDDCEYWLLQYSNGSEGVVVDGVRVPWTSTFEKLTRAATELGITIDEADAMPIELDVVQRWLARPTLDTIDAAVFLDAWDLFADIARSVPEESWGTDAATERVYEKLFWGSTSLGSADEPERPPIGFIGPEAVRLRQVMRRGLTLFRERVIGNGSETG